MPCGRPRRALRVARHVPTCAPTIARAHATHALVQVEVLARLRKDPNNQRLRDALLVSINGIAAGMRNTG